MPVSDHFSGYIAAVDQALETAFEVRYTELLNLSPAMDRNRRFAERAAAEALAPEAFAEAFGIIHKFDVASKEMPGRAREYNLRRAAIAGFAGQSGDARREFDDVDWQWGSDGRAYGIEKSGRVLRLDIANKEDLWGFVVSAADDVPTLAMDPKDPLHRRLAPDDHEFAWLASAFDIGDAIERALKRLPADAAEPVATYR